MRQLKLIIAALFLISPFAANADLIRLDFSATGTEGALTGVTESGYAIYDSSIVVPDGIASAVGLFIDLAFSWGGIAYDETTANTGWLMFDALGSLSTFGFGTNCEPSHCSITSTTPGWMMDPTQIRYSMADESGFGGGTTEWSTSVVSVPEPGTLALLGIGLAAMGLARRRKTA